MKHFFVLMSAAALAIPLAGCGSSGRTVPIETHQSITDSLRREIHGMKSQHAALISRLAGFEGDKHLQLTRIADLESTITFLKTQLAKTPAAPPPLSDPGLAYQHALGLFRGKEYAQAAQEFQSLLSMGVELTLQDNCRYWLGECFFGSKAYGKGIEQFRQIFLFEKSEKKDESQMMIARSYAAMGNTAQAKAEYQKLIETFPASPYRKKAEAQMSRFK